MEGDGPDNTGQINTWHKYKMEMINDLSETRNGITILGKPLSPPVPYHIGSGVDLVHEGKQKRRIQAKLIR